MGSKLVCWQCGESLRGVPRPIRRLTRCPTCRADLHVCRLCRHYDPRVLGECRHDRADRVVDKESANFCTYFRPRPGAHESSPDTAADAARGELEALFGVEEGVEGEATRQQRDPKAEAERARRELESLFGVDEKDDSEDES